MRPKLTLDVLNFALAGAREGFGPFLGVFLQARGFEPAMTGVVMSIAGLSGLVATTPLGALIDRTERKRLALVLAVAAIAVGAVVIVVAHRLWLLGAGQVLIGVGDTAIAPLVAAITLGVVGADAFGARTARNEAFNHAGNAANATFAAVLGYAFGLGYVALAMVVMAIMSSLTTAQLAPEAIDHVAARSGEQDGRSTVRALLATPGLLPFATAVMLFQTANGAMLPFLAQARTAAGDNASVTTGIMIVVARLAMVAVSIHAPRLAARRTYAGVLTYALATVVARGALAYFATSWLVVVPVQILEGIAMGLAGVAIPALNADIMAGTGRVNAGLGVVLTAYGIGGTLSPLVAGFAAQRIGFFGSFLVLGAIAGLGLIGWALARRSGRRLGSPAAAATFAG